MCHWLEIPVNRELVRSIGFILLDRVEFMVGVVEVGFESPQQDFDAMELRQVVAVLAARRLLK